MMLPRLIAPLFLLRLCLLAVAGPTEVAGQRNVTIDDEYGDEVTHVVPAFTPLGGWSLKGGTTALAKPDASLANNGTWHDATQHAGDLTKTVNFNFTGISLYVYCIIANTPPGPSFDAFANYNFFLDGKFVGKYTHDAEMIPDYVNTLVYINTTMENGFHSFSIALDASEKPVLMLFDYATYTTIDQTSPTLNPTDSLQATDKPASNAGVVIGNTLGAVALAFSMAAMIFPVVYL
ncbi:hypothetical protein EYR40_008575 [Pleurotus pulmonarius]|nr:hypothetical protein EYR36_009394 [Pleurotus pulmonarius]KAF4592891.1 hypothetical protein EYR38_008597 [Pleurotus pulmonarius]KAF4593781.1 hypothetical protein EYR40_008575 [Pleurotus pulmonarius]